MGRAWIKVEGEAFPEMRIAHATRVFGLNAAERDIVTLLLAAATSEPKPLRVFDVIEQLSGIHDRVALLAAFAESATLGALALIELRGDGPRLDRAASLSDDVWPRLLGLGGPTESRPGRPLGDLASPPRVHAQAEQAARWLASIKGTWPTVVVQGPIGTGRTAIAEALAATLGCPVLPIDGARVTPSSVGTLRREIAWHQATPVISDADRADPDALAALAKLAACPLFGTSTHPIAERVMAPNRAMRVVETEPLATPDRAAIWRKVLESRSLDLAAFDAGDLGSRFRFSPSRIEAVVSAIASGPTTPSHDDVVALCRSIPEVRAGGLATHVRGQRTWDDLVVTEGVRRELELIVTWGRRRAQLFAADGLGANARAPRGLTCLFHGPSGTGKTLAAQVIAAQLGLELYRVDLSQVVDKYIGETEKRLDLVFREAEAAGVVLFFDEADALFAQRTSVRSSHDRYANLETGFLLQRIEDHDGIVILATNLENNLDPAFQRRVGVIVELALPAAPERKRIWNLLLPAVEARDADVDVELLARSASLAGGDIRNAVVAAVLIADHQGEPLGMKHLAIAIWREIKRAGRLQTPGDLAPWQAHVAAYAAIQRR